jgi:TonB family protein
MPNEDMLNDGEEMTDPGESLGLDADGVAGSDGFGLVSNRGGRALIGGDTGNSALLRKYAWYTQIIQDRIREHLQKQLDDDGGIPDGNLEATVRIVLDEMGQIKAFKIVDSSGSNNMDNAINVALRQVDIDMPPPYDMPKSIKIKVSSKG